MIVPDDESDFNPHDATQGVPRGFEPSYARPTLIPHYYGDAVRELFLGGAALMLVASPLYADSIRTQFTFIVLGAFLAVVFAALTNPRNYWVLCGDAAVSGVGMIFFALWGLIGYDEISPTAFVLRLALALIFLFGFYYSVKTVRAMSLHEPPPDRKARLGRRIRRREPTMTRKKILILLGHPDKSGLCGGLADAYESAAREAGHEVQRMNIDDMQFDPDLHHGYRAVQAIEPDLADFQECVKSCDHLVIVYPVWWYGMPAKLKGLFDRAWLPGSAFRYIMTKTGKRTIFWHRLFRGKTARLILTSGGHPFLIRMLPGTVNSQLRWGILWFAGFSVRTVWFGPAEDVSDAQKARWIARARELGAKGA